MSATQLELQIWTKDQVAEKLETNQNWLERGILAIWDRQTFEEQQLNTTKEGNGVGFSGFDAEYLSYLARWIQSGRHLSGDHLDRARRRMKKYAGQLTKIANKEI